MGTTPESKEQARRPASTATARVSQAVDLYNAARFDLAAQSARAAVAADHGHAPAHAILACALAQLERGREALAEADTALSLDPECALAHGARADAFLALGLPWHAELAAREALRIDPTDVNLITDLATILLRSTRFDEALAAADQALRLAPYLVRALRVRAVALAYLHRPYESFAMLAGALASEPDSAHTHAAVGLAFETSGNLDAAAQAYREALRLDPSLEIAAERLVRVTAWYRWLLPAHVFDWVRTKLL